MTYGTDGFANEITDLRNRRIHYTYTSFDRIETVADPEDGATRSRKYLPLHVAEFEFRYNNRMSADIFGAAIRAC